MKTGCIHIGLLSIILSVFSGALFGGLTPEEKELEKEIKIAVIRKEVNLLPDLILKLQGENISDKFRYYYCKIFFMSSAYSRHLSPQGCDAIIEVLVKAYNDKERDKKAQWNILAILKTAMNKINRNADKCIAIMGFFKEVSVPEAIKSIRKIIPRFKTDTNVLNAIFGALENIRVKESISLIINIYVNASKKIKSTEQDGGQKVQRALIFYQRISRKAQWALESLSGHTARDPKAFNKWWMKSRSTFKVPEKKKKEPPAKKQNSENEADQKGEDNNEN